MIRALRRTAVVLVISAAPALTALRAQTAAPPAPPVAPLVVPFELAENGLIVVKASVAGSEPLPFVLDTASTASTLDPTVAKRLGLASGSAGTGKGAAVEAKLDVGGLSLPNHRFVLAAPRRVRSASIAGTLAAPFLENTCLTIDYDAKTIAVTRPGDTPPRLPLVVLPIVEHDGVPAVRATIMLDDGSLTDATLDVDTGSTDSIVLYPAFVAKHPQLTAAGSKAVIGRVAVARFDFYKMHDWITAFPARGTGDPPAATDGRIGSGVLKRYEVVIDRRRKRVGLTPSELFHVPYDYEMTGMTLVESGGGFAVGEVFPGTPAEAAGLRPGDRVVGLDGKPVGVLSIHDLRASFVQDGKDRVLDIRRGEEAKTIHLKTAAIASHAAVRAR